MIRGVPLQRLPDGIRFPDALKQRIQYDAAQRQLQFDGYMSKTEFDMLIRLNNSIEYQRSLERLFQICIYEADEAQRWPLNKLVYVGLTAVTAVLVIGGVSLFLLVR